MVGLKASPSYLAIVLLITLYALSSPVYAASPDLTVSGIWLERASAPGVPVAATDLASNESFVIVANVTNIGQATAYGFYLDVYYDSQYGRGGPDNITAGEVQQWFVGPLTATPGPHTTKWVVDPDNQIAELNETNNQNQYTFTIGQQITTTTTTSSSTTSSTTTSSPITTTSTTTTSTTLSTASSTGTTATTTASQPKTSTVTSSASSSSTQRSPTTSTTSSTTSPTTRSSTITTTTASTTQTSSSTTRSTTTSSTSKSTTTKTTVSTTSCKGRKCRKGEFYLLPLEDPSPWWISLFLLLTGAWLGLRLPRYWTGGLSTPSQLMRLSSLIRSGTSER